MPLVRVEVGNEYGLGMPELYTETNREDPKAVLEGVTVAGLVGILRQLGDLSEFAAEVFHGIEEQVLITSSRIHKLGESLYNIEAALPPLEKAILAQGSHLHFAYTSGSRWHTRFQTEQNHFIYSDLPKCIMDSYEDCHDPPRLHKLDKFDTGGRGSCFKRYSDPTYFKRASTGSYGIHLQSITREKKARRSKKKKSLSRHRDMTHEAPIFSHGSRMDFASPNSNTKASSLDVSTIHVTPKSITEPETEYHLTSFDSRNGSGYIDRIFHPSYSTQSEENKANEPSSDSNMQQNSYLDPTSLHENVENSNLQENSRPRSSFITWDEKLEIVKSTEISCTTNKLDTDENEDLSSRVDLIDFDFHDECLAISVIAVGQPDEIESETDYYLDSLNIIESEPETDEYCHTKSICSPNPKQTSHESPNNETEHSHQATSHQIVCTPSISSTSTDDIKSEKDEITDTNIAILSTREATNSVMFWTNGGLLGLAPSKPPDFDSATESKDGPIQDSSQEKGAEDDEHIGSSRIFEFSNRLLVNGFRRQKSLVPENPSIPAMVKPFEEQFGSGSPSSPPLEHMKISFQLIDGIETCTLKLNCHESMFPSFQLVPEYDISLHELDLDSEDDDDTFFRSSQYASDECLSHRSESNSEQWDSGDSLETSLDHIVSRVDEKQGVKPHPNHKNVETQNESNCIDCMKVVAEKEDFLQQIRKKAV